MIQHARRLARGRAGPQVQNPSRAVPARIDLGCPRSAFTMVELLVVMVVIGILAGITLGALNAARESARVAKTKTTIAKLDSIILEKYESYLTRRVPVNTSGLDPRIAAAVRLLALRDLMRMEMPERWTDVTNGPITTSPSNWPNPTIATAVSNAYATRAISRPALSEAYKRRCTNLTSLLPSEDYANAECLYLIVTLGSPESRALFSDSEVGDADNDGYFEFHDAWGNPIRFFRWAPRFTDSDVQSMDPVTDHDPFDPYTLEIDTDPTKLRGHRLVPLIYSAGPDGQYGIAQGYDDENNLEYVFGGSPYFFVKSGSVYPNTTGQPTEDGYHFDNIHNHRLEVK